MTLFNELNGFNTGRRYSCGDGPYKPGRPKKDCTNVLKSLRALCKKMEGHTYQKRICRLKLKPGRKPNNMMKVFKTAAMGAAKAIANVRKTPKAPASARKSPVRVASPRVAGCHMIRYTADEKRALRAPRTTPGSRQMLKNKCTAFKNDKGRVCKVNIPKGLCKAA